MILNNFKKNSLINKTLSLSNKKLSLKSIGKIQRSSDSIREINKIKTKDCTTVINQTELPKIELPKQAIEKKIGDLTYNERQIRLKVFLDAKKREIANIASTKNIIKIESKNIKNNNILENAKNCKYSNLDHKTDDIKTSSCADENHTNQPVIKNKLNLIEYPSHFYNDKYHDNKNIKIAIVNKKKSKKILITPIDDFKKDNNIANIHPNIDNFDLKDEKKHTQTSNYKKIYRKVKIYNQNSVQELAVSMTEKINHVIKILRNLCSINSMDEMIDMDTAELLVQELGHTAVRVFSNEDSIFNESCDSKILLTQRPPIVTVMGHVDHGKTSLLDALKQTDIASKESGGITQHIGAYSVLLKNGSTITFIDTPGHEAFTAMRMRGAQITDIVVIVISADDGIKEQTVEAINHAKSANVAIIVAITKIDKTVDNIPHIKNSLFKYELVPEDMGGDIAVIAISAKKKQGLKELEDAILLQAECLNITANTNTLAEGIIIESRKSSLKGILVTSLIQKGTLNIGDIIVIDEEYFKVRTLRNCKGQKIYNAMPSMPVEISGLKSVPQVGDKFRVVKNEKIAKKAISFTKNKKSASKIILNNLTSFEDLLKAKADNCKAFNIIIKSDTEGSLGAIKDSLLTLSSEKIIIKITHSMAGDINTSDISLAKVTNSIVLGFNVKICNQASKLAKSFNVSINCHSIIYDFINDVKQAMNQLILPSVRENIIGYAEIKEIITLTKIGNIAGCVVTEGLINRKSNVRIVRKNKIIYNGKLSALKRFKNDVTDVNKGFECGVSFEKFYDFKKNDKLEFYVCINNSKSS